MDAPTEVGDVVREVGAPEVPEEAAVRDAPDGMTDADVMGADVVDADVTGVRPDVVDVMDVPTNACDGGGRATCQGVCVNTTTDPSHCGRCDNAC